MIDLHEYFAVRKFLQKEELPHLSKLTSFSRREAPCRTNGDQTDPPVIGCMAKTNKLVALVLYPQRKLWKQSSRYGRTVTMTRKRASQPPVKLQYTIFATRRLGTLVKTSFNVVMATFTLKWNYKQSGVRVSGGKNLRELSVPVKQKIVDKKRPLLTPPSEIGANTAGQTTPRWDRRGRTIANRLGFTT